MPLPRSKLAIREFDISEFESHMPSHGVVSLRARPYLRLARSQVKERRTSTTASGQSASILQLALAGCHALAAAVTVAPSRGRQPPSAAAVRSRCAAMPATAAPLRV